MQDLDIEGLQKLMLRKGYKIAGFTIRDIQDGAYLGSDDGVFVADSEAVAQKVLALNIAQGKTKKGKIEKIRVKEVVQYARDALVAFSTQAYANFNTLAAAEGVEIGEPSDVPETLHKDVNHKIVLFGIGSR